MTEYKVIWTIELDADNAPAAAELARQFQTDPDSISHVYAVTDPDGATVTIDLDFDPDGLKPITQRGAIAILDSARDRLWDNARACYAPDSGSIGCDTCDAVSLITGRIEQLLAEVTT